MQNNLFLCILDLGMGKHTKPDNFFLEISKGGDFQTKKKVTDSWTFFIEF